MCKKLIILCAALVIVGLSVPALADLSYANPLLVDINGDGGTTNMPGWQQWVIGPRNGWANAVQAFTCGTDTVTATLTTAGSANSYARNRSGGWAGPSGTGEYSETGKGLGTSYATLKLEGLTPDKEYLFNLWSYEAPGVWVINPSNPSRNYGVWCTTNPSTWLATYYNDGKHTLGGYSPADVNGLIPGGTTESNIPGSPWSVANGGYTGPSPSLYDLVMANGGRCDMNSAAEDGNQNDRGDLFLGTPLHEVSFLAKTKPIVYDEDGYVVDPGGWIKIYGWNDDTDYGGSMHMPLEGFTVMPEPVTIALLGLGGLALLRRKRA